jgi:hypothetical protein
MTCRYCNTDVPSHSIADVEFCCDYHRQLFESEGPQASEVSEPAEPAEPEIPAALRMLRLKFGPRPKKLSNAEAPDSELEAAPTPELGEAALEPIATEAMAEPEPGTDPIYVAERYEQTAEGGVEERGERYEESAEEASEDPRLYPAREIAASWRWLNAAWKGAPRDLKLVSLLLPVLLAVAVTGSIPKVPIRQAPQNLDQVQKVVEDHWKNLNQTISNRAAVAFTDDFRSGLDAWESRSNLTTSWSYDQAGFVRPGPLAVFKPTVDLSDYRFEFLAEIDQRALGWAFRAADLNNYYATKFVVVKPGALPLVRMVRYVVIDGKERSRVEKPLPLTVRADMLYRIQVNVQGSDFTIMAQGQVVDFWSDNRLRQGGVGFFCNRGERARLRWVEVSHQYDALGRLCAYLAPYGIEGRNGNIN